MDESLTVIGDLPGYTPQIGRLLGMMRYARQSVLWEVEGLTQDQLDHLHDPESNTIGALLHHAASVEWVYQVQTFDEREPTAAELEVWGPALDLGAAGRAHLRGRPPAYYLDLLASVRARTLEEFRRRDDAWLAAPLHPAGHDRSNRHFFWFHVMEDELNHRGQIRWLKRRLPGATRA